MKTAFIAFLIGALFGVGLIVSGMSNPAKVIGFLDITGAWDPSLALVMAGAIAVALMGFRVAKHWQSAGRVSWLGAPIRLPTTQKITPPLIVGSLFFGAGWGLVGFCPGPALVALGTGNASALYFVGAMIAGMALAPILLRLFKQS